MNWIEHANHTNNDEMNEEKNDMEKKTANRISELRQVH